MADPGAKPSAWLTERLLLIAQSLVPQRGLTRLAHAATRWRWEPWKNALIGWFVRHYGVDLTEAASPRPEDYPDFNAFFTRSLRAGARPLATDPKAALSPIDGRVSQIGSIESGRLLQAKGKSFEIDHLLGGDRELEKALSGGVFATLYLSPRDYHRVHMPLQGHLRRMIYIPGRLFGVNPPSVRAVPGLFARNERVVTFFDTAAGPMVMVLVGAMLVASTETVWSGPLVPPHGGNLRRWDYEDGGPSVARGEEMGRFGMGSTVILLFGRDRVIWDEGLGPGVTVRMGARIGRLT